MLMFLFSCNSDDKVKSEKLRDMSFQDMMKTEIGLIKDGKVVLDIADSDLINKFQKYSNDFKLGVEPVSVEVVTIDSNHYLRFENTNNSVSTIALVKVQIPNERKLHVGVELGNTVCTSTDCASGGGCVPNGDYCTKCQKGSVMGSPIYGDCTRSTSN